MMKKNVVVDTVAPAMLGVLFDFGGKVNRHGAN